MDARLYSQLTRRTFLKIASVTAGLGGVYLTGCDSATHSQTGKKTPTPVYAVAQGLPATIVPMGLGINLQFSTSDMNAQIAQLATVGFRFARLDMLWNIVEKQQGQYDFSAYKRIIDALAAYDMRALFILDYNNSLYDNTHAPPFDEIGPHTGTARQAFGRFAAGAVATFKAAGVVWEIWNEPDNPRFWYPQPNPDDYMNLTKVTIDAMRRADPSATIVAPAMTGLEPKYQSTWDFLERCFALGLLGLVDAISVHPYRLGPPESAALDYQRMRSLMARYAPPGKANLPIISSEWGYSLTWVSEQQQAQYFARLFLINVMHAFPVSVWYNWHDGPNPKQIEDNFGLLTWKDQPKTVYFAAQTLAQELTGFRFGTQQPLTSTADYALLFTNGATKKLVVWTTSSAHTVTLPANSASITATSMTGDKTTLAISGGSVMLEISGSPQYLALS